MKRRSAASRQRNWELSAKAVLLPLLSPGDNLRIALSGATGGLEGGLLIDLFLALIGWMERSEQYRTTYIGITDKDLVFAISKDPEKLTRLRRASLGNVSIVRFKEKRKPFMNDVLVIDTGTKRLTLLTGASLRPEIRELIADLDRRRREAELTDSSGQLDGKHARKDTPRPLLRRLFHLFAPVPRGIATTLRTNGPAQASLHACRHSLTMLAASLAAGLFLVVGIAALGFIFPGGLAEPIRDFLLFILSLPLLLTTLLGSFTALAAIGLAIYSIIKRGEKPLTVIAALLGSGAVAFVYYVIAALLLTIE